MGVNFRNKLMRRKRFLRLTPLPKIRIKVGTDKTGVVHYKFGDHGKQACPNQYDENGVYIKGQPFYCWSYGTAYRPDYPMRWNRELIMQLSNYLKVNVKHIHPADLAD